MCYCLLAEIFLITSDKSFVVVFPLLILSRPLKESWYYFSGTSAQRRDHKKKSDGETGAKAGSEKGNGRFEAEGWVSW